MDSYKTYTADIHGFKDIVLIITTASYEPGKYPVAEGFVIINNEKITRRNFKIRIDRNVFSDEPINSSEDYLHDEALNQAKKFIDSQLFEKYTDKGNLAPIYKIVESENVERELLRHQVRGHITQAIQDIKNITNSHHLKTYLNTISGLKPYTVEGF